MLKVPTALELRGRFQLWGQHFSACRCHLGNIGHSPWLGCEMEISDSVYSSRIETTGHVGVVPPTRAEGFVVGYMLFALALLSMLVVASSQFADSQQKAKWIAATKDKLEQQGNLIISHLAACAVLNTSESSVQGDANYMTTSGTLVDASSVICPSTNTTIWDSSVGAFPPVEPSGFNKWKYFKSTVGSDTTVFISIQADDLAARPALYGLMRNRFGSVQAELSQTFATDDTLKIYLIKPE